MRQHDCQLGGDEPSVPVLIVDDQALFRDVIRDVVCATPGMTPVGEAASGEEALGAVEALSPRLVIMDKRMPGIGGVEAARLITARHPDIVVVLMSVEEPAHEALEAGNAGAILNKQHLSPATLAHLWRTHGV